MYVINTIAPVFIAIALGFALRRGRFLTDELIKGINRLAYWVALPALLFSKIAAAPDITSGAGKALAVVLVGIGGCIVAGYIVAKVFHMPAGQRGTFVQASFRGNLTFMGLAVVLYAFPDNQAAQTTAVLTLAPIVPIHNFVAVIVLLTGQHRLSASAVGKMARQIATNPMLLACVAGIGWSLAGWSVPTAADRTLGVIGQLALPAALIAIGGSLAAAKFAGKTLYAVLAATIKVALAPALGYLAAVVIGAEPHEAAVALIFLACPTAVASYILADQLDGDSTLASGAIVISTVLSIISLSVVLALV